MSSIYAPICMSSYLCMLYMYIIYMPQHKLMCSVASLLFNYLWLCGLFMVILQAGIPEWVTMPSCRRSSQRVIEPTSLMSPALAGGFFTTSVTWEAHICHHLRLPCSLVSTCNLNSANQTHFSEIWKLDLTYYHTFIFTPGKQGLKNVCVCVFVYVCVLLGLLGLLFEYLFRANYLLDIGTYLLYSSRTVTMKGDKWSERNRVLWQNRGEIENEEIPIKKWKILDMFKGLLVYSL